MSLDTDLAHTAVTIATLTLTAHLPNAPATVLEAAAVDMLAAVRPYLDGTERRRVTTTGSNDADDPDVLMPRDGARNLSLD
jgi:hypothetical protein